MVTNVDNNILLHMKGTYHMLPYEMIASVLNFNLKLNLKIKLASNYYL